MSRPKEKSRATISDVAALAGASRTSVSRFLGSGGEHLSPDLRRRIEAAVVELDYRPSSVARGLRRNESKMIGFVVADITNPYAVSVLRGAEEVCKERGYVLLVCNTDGDPSVERYYCTVLQDQRVDGLLINATGENDGFLRRLAQTIPTVLVDRKLPDLEVDMVGTDNRDAMRQAVDHLLESGFEHIGFFTDTIGVTSPRVERVDELHKHLARHELSDVAQVFEFDAHAEDAVDVDSALDQFLAGSRGRRRVIFAGNGVVLLKLYGRMVHRNLRIPEEVALIGFDAPEWSLHVPPGITVIAQPTAAIGAKAMELILDMIDGRPSTGAVYELPAELQVRGSTTSSRSLAEATTGKGR